MLTGGLIDEHIIKKALHVLNCIECARLVYYKS